MADDFENIPLLVELPSGMEDFLEESGFSGAAYDELRSNARKKIRREAILETDRVLYFVTNRAHFSKVLLKDLSVQGVGFLTHEQLWPEETYWVRIDQHRIHCKVARCRKHSNNCYEVGATLLLSNSTRIG